MKRKLLSCICAVLLLTLIPTAAFAEEGDLEALASQISSAGSIDDQLALINDAADLVISDPAYDGWDISLNASLAGDLPEGFLPENYDEAEAVDEMPEDLKEGAILALYDDEGSISLLGDFMVRFSTERRAATLDTADIVLVVQHDDVARTDYIGSAYDRRYYGYIWRVGSDQIYRVFYRNNTPPFSGMGVLYGDSMSKKDLWEEMRFLFFGNRVFTEGEGITTTYTQMNDGWHLSDVEGDRMTLEVPGEIDGEPVVAVSTSLTYTCPSLQRIVLAEGVKNIEDGVFKDLDNLTEVSLPEGLVSIGAEAFKDCDSLTELTIPDSVESIGNNAFSSMDSLAKLNLPAAPVDLASGVITGFNSIGSLALPEGLTELPGDCFQGSYGLTALYIPSSVVNFPDSFPEWIMVYTPQGSPAMMWAEKQGLATAACDSADDMPQISVEQDDLLYYVVYDGEATLVNTLSGIQYVMLPDTLGGAPLTKIRHAFYQDYEVAYVSVPEGVTEIGNNFCDGCGDLEQVLLPSTLTKIGKYAFNDCYDLTSLTIPEGVQSIGDSFASDCSSLTSVTLPSTLSELPPYFLEYNTSLTSLVVPEGVRTLPSGMLYYCKSLYSLYLPKSVVQIEADIPSQVTIYAPEGSPALMWAESNQYAHSALEYPTQMPTAELVDDGEFVYILFDGEAFLKEYNSDATTLVMPETLGGAPVTRILEEAISSDYLTSVTVADSVRRIDNGAFYDNDGLENLYLPETIEYMDDGAIRGIYHDCTVYAPEGSYAYEFVSQDLNCSGGHVFTLENWDHVSSPVEKAEGTAGDMAGFFPDIEEPEPEPPLMTYGVYAQAEPIESTVMDDGSIYQLYIDVTKDDYYAYGNELGSNGYSILESSTENGIANLTLAKDGVQFTMTYNSATETMEFTFPEGTDVGVDIEADTVEEAGDDIG